MNAVHNPMIVQMWLWGLDAMHGDLSARGFEKTPRPIKTESSVYHREGLHLHGFGLWLEHHPALNEEVLIYRRPSKTWYALPAQASVCIEHFSKGDRAWCDFARPRVVAHKPALALMRESVLEYEAWLIAQRGCLWRTRQLERIPSRAVRRARGAWRDWLNDGNQASVAVSARSSR